MTQEEQQAINEIEASIRERFEELLRNAPEKIPYSDCSFFEGMDEERKKGMMKVVDAAIEEAAKRGQELTRQVEEQKRKVYESLMNPKPTKTLEDIFREMYGDRAEALIDGLGSGRLELRVQPMRIDGGFLHFAVSVCEVGA